MVVHVVAPGAQSYKRIAAPTGDPNDVDCDINAGRAKNPDEGTRRLSLIKMLAFSRTFVALMVALPHRSGMLPFNVSFVTSAFLDWLYMLLERHVVNSIFNTRVGTNMGRFKVGAVVPLRAAW